MFKERKFKLLEPDLLNTLRNLNVLQSDEKLSLYKNNNGNFSYLPIFNSVMFTKDGDLSLVFANTKNVEIIYFNTYMFRVKFDRYEIYTKGNMHHQIIKSDGTIELYLKTIFSKQELKNLVEHFLLKDFKSISVSSLLSLDAFSIKLNLNTPMLLPDSGIDLNTCVNGKLMV